VSARLIRLAFDRDGTRTNMALRELVPDDVSGEVDVPYGTGPDEQYDVWRPAGADAPIVFWVHGGGWIAGDKAHQTSYAKILAGRGFEVVMPNYTLSPAVRYPHALHQVCAALTSAVGRTDRPFVLAGDSAGAHLAAQVALLLTNPAYAEQVGVRAPVGRPAGALLHCGPYVPAMVRDSRGAGGWFVRTVATSYLGTRDFDAPVFEEVDLVRHASPDFPPTWISGGNGDPLTGQGLAFAARLSELGVPVSPVFYPRDHEPTLGHEYQFDLTLAESRAALEDSVAFLRSVTG
jgi:acetyl esterase